MRDAGRRQRPQASARECGTGCRINSAGSVRIQRRWPPSEPRGNQAYATWVLRIGAERQMCFLSQD
eukprot:877697-Alexandrium_andersonii.AAC.1